MSTRWIRGGAVVLFLLATGLAGTARAQEPRYTFVEAGWIHENPEDSGADNGWFGGGSVGTRRFHVFAEYQDPGPFEVWEAGGGWHGLLGRRADIVAEAAYLDAESDEGYRATAGVRWYVADRLEIGGYLNRLDVGSFENNALSVEGVWDFTKRFSVGASLLFGDESDTFRGFARFYLGKN
jgi:hypothetical protein